MFEFVMSLLLIFTVAVVQIKVQGKILKSLEEKTQQPESMDERHEEEKHEEARKTLRYDVNPLVESAVIYNATVSYTGFIGGLIDKNLVPNGIVKPLEELREQEMRMNGLFSEISGLLDKIGINGTEYIYATIQGCLDTYAANRNDFVDAVDDLCMMVLKQNRKQQVEKIVDIMKDNRQILLSMEKFYKAIAMYLAKVNRDETTAHITDFTAVAELDRLAETFEKVVNETEKEIENGMAEKEPQTLSEFIEKYKYLDEPGDARQQLTQPGGEQLTLQTGGGH